MVIMLARQRARIKKKTENKQTLRLGTGIRMGGK